MKYRTLGKSTLEISEIGFGCMSLTGDHMYDTRLLQEALNRGINFFDTADLYEKGNNEVLLGKALQGKRAQAIIATKVGNQWKKDGSGWDWNPRKEYIISSVEGSLQRLQTDYIDLYQLHGGTIEDPIDETIAAFELLKQQGKIRYYGISSIRPNVIREYITHSNIVSVMMQYSLLDRRPEETCLPLLQEHGIGVLSRGGLAKGLLVDKPAIPYLGYSEKEVKYAAEAVRKIAGDKGHPARTALQFVLQHPAITSAVVGIRTMPQLEDVITTPDIAPLSVIDRRYLAESLPPNTYAEHR
jgi:aryl-alcohol dehydrogenase-like predicted oxidoreductase